MYAHMHLLLCMCDIMLVHRVSLNMILDIFSSVCSGLLKLS